MQRSIPAKQTGERSSSLQMVCFRAKPEDSLIQSVHSVLFFMSKDTPSHPAGMKTLSLITLWLISL